MKLAPLSIQLPEATRAALDRQAQHLGFPTANQWAATALNVLATVNPDQALLVLGKLRTLNPKSRNPRLSDI